MVQVVEQLFWDKSFVNKALFTLETRSCGEISQGPQPILEKTNSKFDVLWI